MKLFKYILLSIFIGILPLFFSGSIYGQLLNVKHFTIEDGMSQTSVQCLMQDRKGFLWIGTQDGLNKYDGYTFTRFKHDPTDTTTISNNYIHCIYEDSDDNIWVGTNYGLNKFDAEKQTFFRYLNNDSSQNTIPEDEVYSIYQDNSGFIWIKTERFLSRLNPKTEKFRHYEHFNDIFNFISVNAKFSIFEDHKNQLWVGTKDGLNYFDRDLEIFKRYNHDPDNIKSISNNRVKVIFEDSRDNLWIGTKNGLNRFNWENESFTRFFNSRKGENLNNNINDIYEDSDKNLWIATEDGLNKFDRKTEQFITYNEFKFENNIVLTTSVTSILEDKTGILWVGTLQGLIKIEKRRKKFNLYAKNNKGEFLFSNNYISSIYTENDSILWVGTWGTGLHTFNRNTNKVTRFFTGNSSLKNDYVHKIFKSNDGDYWLGTQDGISFFDKEENVFSTFENNNISQILNKNRIYDIIESDSGNFWIGTKYGLHNIKNDSIVKSYIANDDDEPSISSNLVYDLLLDSKNNLWIATDHGLNKLDLISGNIEKYFKSNAYCEDCLSSNEILCLYEDTINHDLWLGTVNGLNKMNLQTKRFVVYTEKDGLPNNLIYSILADDDRNLWMSTNRGLSMFNPEDESFSNFNVADGVQDSEFNLGAYFKSSSGEIFFGGIAGLNSFYPDSIQINENVPKIAITSIELLANDRLKRVSVGENNFIRIPYRNNLITIEFAALDFTNPAKNSYAYKMKGIEEEWINLGNRRYATFSNLPPGKYTFRVKGANSDYVWNEKGALLEIEVLTPFWRTKLAFAFYILLILFMIFWIIQYRTKTLRRSNQELKEKELIAKQVAKQKEELTIKNKSITDSIVYAKRIQEALMPSLKFFKSLLPSTFILYKPKDIVSGDFYWVNIKNDKIFIAVVDCTGHGVPGAFMSIIGFELLRKITDDQGIDEADKILEELNRGVSVTFGKESENVRLKDGMDIALCVIDKKNALLEFAGAFRPLYFIRDNKIEEIRGNRFSVGLLEDGTDDHINKTIIKLKKDDIFYLFSDGYADQFGGPDGKKYKYRRFRHLLLTIHKLPLEQQLAYLDKSFEDWRGNQEQVDDVLIVGVKPALE
ncbi:MAG TPA: two-component regulator propeller domain-containing protein [Bacteroidales bacterium]|nr:two-component regulator propeller domain-containing protein [Bacteroidales bacterium]